MLTADMKRIVDEQRLGFVATVDADGSPNLSPKGTFVVIDDAHIAFADLRSPGTLRNLARGSLMEVNFVDPFARKGYRFKGRARVVQRSSDEYAALLPRFARYGQLIDRARAIVVLAIERALPLVTPAYDIGADEAALRAQWARHFGVLQPGGRFPE